MLAYARRRVINFVIVMWVVVTAMFFLLHLAPGSPVNAMPAAVTQNPAARAAYAKALGLDKNLIVQYWDYLTGLVRGDFGSSYMSGSSVTSLIAEHLPVTVELCILGGIVAVIPGFLLGAWAAMRSGTRIDAAARILTVISLSVPVYWLAVVVLVFVGRRFSSVLPSAGGYPRLLTDPVANLQVTILPAIVVGLGVAAFVARSMRASMLGVLSSDYVTFANAMGMTRRAVMRKVALRNAAIPTLTVGGALIGTLISADVLIEGIFQIPGIGQLVVTAYLQQDYPVALGISIVFAGVFLACNLIVDLLCYVIDPRTQVAQQPRGIRAVAL